MKRAGLRGDRAKRRRGEGACQAVVAGSNRLVSVINAHGAEPIQRMTRSYGALYMSASCVH